MTKRILAIGAALLLCLFCVCAWAEGENCRLTLTLAFGEQPVEGAEFSLYRVGEMQMSGGAAGFVPLAALNAPASTTHLTASVIKDKVNVRSEADSQNGAIIDKARTGERLLVTDYGNKWTGIVLPDGKRGYIMTEYLQFD